MREKVGSGAQSDIPPIYHVPTSHASSVQKRKETLVCHKCNKTFSYTRHLNKHLEGHKRNDCQQCNETFASRKGLELHMCEKHSKRLQSINYSCKFCEKKFSRSSLLYSHYRVHHADGFQVCEFCGEFCTNDEEFKGHIKKHEENRLACVICHQTFSRLQQYSMHMQNHDKYQCLTCRLGFSAKKILMKHKQQGHAVYLPDSFKCSVCSKTFRYKASLTTHQKQHTSKKMFKCKSCNEIFSTSECLSVHLNTDEHALHITTEDQGFVCEHCGKRFVHQQSLNVHRSRNHTARKTYSCGFCSHTTNFKANLTRHIRLHLNERSFVCEQCGAAFYVLSALKDHYLYIHSDERKHHCDKCPKTFKRSSELKRHQRTHSNIRPHACTSCNRAFKRSSHLKRHREQFHKEKKIATRQVQRLRQDEAGTFQPLSKESKKSSVKNSSPSKIDNTQILVFPYEEVVSFKHITDDGMCKDISTVDLECSRNLNNPPAAHFLVLPTQPLPSSESNLIYLTATSVHSLVEQQETKINKSSSHMRETEVTELLKHRQYDSSNELNTHMLLAPHETSIRNVLGSDVKLSDSMMDDVVDPQQPSPGRDSPLCMSDLVRLQDSFLCMTSEVKTSAEMT